MRCKGIEYPFAGPETQVSSEAEQTHGAASLRALAALGAARGQREDPLQVRGARYPALKVSFVWPASVRLHVCAQLCVCVCVCVSIQ